MGYWGRGRVWARLGCAGAWEVGMAAPAPNLFCREKMLVSRACRAGEERAEPRHQQKKNIWESPLKERKQEKGCCGQPHPHWDALQPPTSCCPGTDLPGRVLLPGSPCSPSLTSKSGCIQAGTSALAQRRRATPERQDGLSLFSRVWAGSRLGRAGPPRPVSL